MFWFVCWKILKSGLHILRLLLQVAAITMRALRWTQCCGHCDQIVESESFSGLDGLIWLKSGWDKIHPPTHSWNLERLPQEVSEPLKSVYSNWVTVLLPLFGPSILQLKVRRVFAFKISVLNPYHQEAISLLPHPRC